MGLFNILADSTVSVFGQTFDVSLNWIGELIRWLCTIVGTVGVGIILFSLVLKLITLPFDIVQRISMRKQNLQMKANQEQMEKLQKQYANDKQMYNQKVMEMYKANGISMFSSCLPMILSMVIFFVAIGAFNAYAQYSNVENYNTMVNAYNDKMMTYCVDLDLDNYDSLVTVGEADTAGIADCIVKDTATDGKYVYYVTKVNKAEFNALSKEERFAYIKSQEKTYYSDATRAYENAEIKAYVDKAIENADDKEKAKSSAVSEYFQGQAQNAVVVAYENEVKPHAGFLWIKNIWETDASYKHPVPSASEFKSEVSREEFEVYGEDVKFENISKYTNGTNPYAEDSYIVITAKLDVQKGSANGYFILIALSIGTILLQQWVTQRSQKEQQKFSSVDGQAGSQQKMTMIIMTGMFSIFSFMYSSAFSIYMITSNLFSLLSTLVINKAVDGKAAKKEREETIKHYENHASDRIEKAISAGKQSAEESKNKRENNSSENKEDKE